MVLNPTVRELRDALDARGIPHDDEDVDEEGAVSQCTVWEHDGDDVVALWAYAVDEDSEKVGLSLGWRLADVLELSFRDATRMLTVEDAMRDYA